MNFNWCHGPSCHTNSTGLTIYNPKNLADRVKGMKNKREKTRAEKIAERLLYEEKNQATN